MRKQTGDTGSDQAKGCPVDHESIKQDEVAWSRLTFIGLQQDWDDDGNYAPLALANCTSGTTLARRADVHDQIAGAALEQMRRDLAKSEAA